MKFRIESSRKQILCHLGHQMCSHFRRRDREHFGGLRAVDTIILKWSSLIQWVCVAGASQRAIYLLGLLADAELQCAGLCVLSTPPQPHRAGFSAFCPGLSLTVQFIRSMLVSIAWKCRAMNHPQIHNKPAVKWGSEPVGESPGLLFFRWTILDSFLSALLKITAALWSFYSLPWSRSYILALSFSSVLSHSP